MYRDCQKKQNTIHRVAFLGKYTSIGTSSVFSGEDIVPRLPKQEIITWYPFPEGLPKKIGHKVIVMRKGEKSADSAIYDRGRVYLNCNGILGSTEVTEKVRFIADAPKGSTRKQK